MKVTRAREPGLLADGDGLYLQISSAESRSWIFRYAHNGRTREMRLGSLKAVGLAAARAKAQQCREQLADGIDPIVARDAERLRLAVENARTITFDQCAEAFIRAHASTWRNSKHHAQWTNTLAHHGHAADVAAQSLAVCVAGPAVTSLTSVGDATLTQRIKGTQCQRSRKSD